MMATPKQVTATFWAAVVPTFGRRWQAGGYVTVVDSVRVNKIWQKQPTKSQLPSGAVVVKLSLRFNEQAFLPLAPVAVIDIPDSMLQMGQVVEVEALDENDVGVAEHLARVARGEV